MDFRKAAVLLVFALAVTLAAAPPNPAKEKAARQAAESWLTLVDSGKYDESWSAAAGLFKSQITKAQWRQAIQKARTQLGKLESRKLKSATYSTSLPGAPDGEYVVIQYESVFQHKKSAVETITPMLDKDGEWRTSGYFIR